MGITAYPLLSADSKVSIVVPIYNEVELLPVVLEHLRRLPIPNMELVLVDDGSTDGTGEILDAQKDLPGVVVLRHQVNAGKGAAIVTGLRAATGNVVIIQDADMEYNPQDILKVIDPIMSNRCNVCFGSRFLGTITGMRFPNRVANHLLSLFIYILFGQRITDEATAYKAFRREVIEAISLKCKRFEFCPEVTAKVILSGERIYEVPVSYIARTFEEGKKIGYRDFFIAVRTMLSCRFGKE